MLLHSATTMRSMASSATSRIGVGLLKARGVAAHKAASRSNSTNAQNAADKPASWLTSETGPLTTHFWGPVANWGLVGAAVYDASFNGPEQISLKMTGVMICYSSLFMRFALAVKPTNYLLFACHTFNVGAQCNQMRRALEHQIAHGGDKAREEIKRLGTIAAAGVAAVGGCVAASGPLQAAVARSALPEFLRNFAAHPAGPFTIHFWGPTSKWLISGASFLDFERPTEKISLAQTLALTCTGVVWTRYSTVITPVNYNLMTVNMAMAASAGYNLQRKVRADYM